jgi:zinc/manganese transport system permease protein
MMIFEYHFMLIALILCLILTGIHTYLGYHIVSRGVIFVDLSLAQVAALGSSVAMLFGWDENWPVVNYAISLAFTFLGAGFFSYFRKFQEKVPVEAMIGITYAAAIALSLLVLEKASSGTEHIKEMLVGALLTVSWKQTLIIAVVYFVIGLLHFLARRQLFIISEDPDKAKNTGMNLGLWDFFFYTTFGIVVTLSVKVAGVLMVFSMLVIPSVASAFCVQNTRSKIIFGWIYGILGCLFGLEASLRFDWPAGPSIITVFLLELIICIVYYSFNKKLIKGK